MGAIIRPLEYKVENDKFIIKIKEQSFRNKEKLILILSGTLPHIERISPVYILVEEEYYPVQDIVGNNLMTDQLRFLPQSTNGGIVRVIYGNNPKHFKVLVSLPDSIY